MKFALYILTFLLFTNTAFAKPSWCKYAKTRMEKTICSDTRISNADSELSVLYKQLRREYPHDDWLKPSQKQWLKYRRYSHDNNELYNYYDVRIEALRSFATQHKRSLNGLSIPDYLNDKISGIKNNASAAYYAGFKKEQKAWEKRILRQCKRQRNTKKCLDSAYRKRFNTLDNLPVYLVSTKGCIAEKTTKVTAKIENICTEDITILNKSMRRSLLRSPLTKGALFDDIFNPSQRNCKITNNEERTQSQYDESIVTVLDNVLVIYKNTFVYAGGAHGNNFGAALNYDRNDASLISWHTLFGDNKKLERYVYQTVQNKFLTKESLPYQKEAIINFKKMGYYRITEKGILLVYPPYELGPYSDGSKMLLLPKKRLKTYMDPKKYVYYFSNSEKTYFDYYCPR